MLGGSASVSADVLAGRDSEITWEDVYRGMCISYVSWAPGVVGVRNVRKEADSSFGGEWLRRRNKGRS